MSSAHVPDGPVLVAQSCVILSRIPQDTLRCLETLSGILVHDTKISGGCLSSMMPTNYTHTGRVAGVKLYPPILSDAD